MSLRRFILHRILSIIPILFDVSVITFGLFHLTPGDPISQMVALNSDISAAEEARIRAQYGLDGPVYQQYMTWMGNVLTGDFGTVIKTNREVPAVPFRVTMANAMPFPVAFRTRSPILWAWEVDGETEATRVPRDPPNEPGEFWFGRGERKRFEKRWEQLFRVSESEWEPVVPGEYTIGARINVDGAVEKGLYDETTVQILPERE